MTQYNKIPCKECLLVPICRHKNFADVISCAPIREYLLNEDINSREDYAAYRRRMTDVLRPTKWHVTDKGFIKVNNPKHGYAKWLKATS